METALSLFAAKGFYNVSMQEIAEGSEFGVGTLYNFFESKEALFEELIKDGAERFLQEILEILDGQGNAMERLRAFILYQPEFQQRHGEIIKLYVSEFGAKGSKLSRIRDENKVNEVLNSKITVIIEQGIDGGFFRPVDPAIAAKSLIAIIETLVFETTGRFDRGEITEMFKKVEQLFLGGLLVAVNP